MSAGVFDAEVRRFAEFRQRVEIYEASWWTLDTEPQSSRFASAPQLFARLASQPSGTPVGTEEVYQDGGVWTADRAATQADIVDDLLGPEGPATGGPNVCYFLLGLPGSGKSQTLRPIARSHASSLGLTDSGRVSDADDVRVSLPEFAGGLGSGVVQEEVAGVTYGDPSRPRPLSLEQRTLDTADARAMVMVDVVGSDEYLPGTVEALVRRSWDVYILVTKCPVELCVERARRRALETGRYVPLKYISKSGRRPIRALNAARNTGLVAGWAEVDTTGGTPWITRGDGAFGSTGSEIGLT